MTGNDTRFWSEEDVANLLRCESDQIRDMACAVGAEPAQLLAQANFSGVDLRGQDLRGLDLRNANLIGAITDDTTLFTNPLTDVFGFSDEDELLDAINVEEMPLLDRYDSIIQILETIVDGAPLVSVHGPGGAGKSIILREVRSILHSGSSLYFVLPPSITAKLRESPTFLISVAAHGRSFSDLLLSELATPDRSGFRRRCLARILGERDFVRAFPLQSNLFNDPYDLLRQARKMMPAQQDRFLKGLFTQVKSLRPDARIVVFVDEFEHLSDKPGLNRLIQSAKGVQWVVGGRTPFEMKTAAGRRSIGHASNMAIDGLTVGAVKQLFDLLEAVTRGAVIFPTEERGRLVDALGRFPQLLVQACKIGVAISLARGATPPVQFHLDEFLAVVYDVRRSTWGADQLATEFLRSDQLGPAVASLERGLGTKGGLAPLQVAKLLSISPKEASQFLRRLSESGLIKRNSSNHWVGSLVAARRR